MNSIAVEIADILDKTYPDAVCTLDYNNPLELLVATILSAQCRDERVNKVTKNLFAKYKKPEDYAQAPPGELEDDIRSLGFFNNKAASLRKVGQKLADGDDKVPRDLKALIALPGVGRKTANVILGNAYEIASGFVVDTHVKRLAARLGLTTHKNPDKIEKDLVKAFPQDKWIKLSHQLILHGRSTCKAQKPNCLACPLAELCPGRELR